MNPNDDNQHDDLFPNAGQRFSHNFYSSDPITPPSQQQQQHYQEPENNDLDEYCPQCDAQLEIRESTLGKYIACTRFPDCRYTRPYQENYDETAPVQEHYAAEEPIEKDYLQEAADEISHHSYDEPNEYSQHYDDHPSYHEEEETAATTENFDERAHGLPPEPYYVEEQPKEEPSEPSFEPSIYGKNMAEPEVYEEQTEPNEEPAIPAEESKQEEQQTQSPVSSHATKKQSLRLHPGFLKKEEVSNSSKWAELKQKRLRDQSSAALSPAEVAAQDTMPSPEELQETLKKLEEDVQKLQQEDGTTPACTS